jgi:hypothetical protein
MTLVSALLVWAVSIMTPKPADMTIRRYFRSDTVAASYSPKQ